MDKLIDRVIIRQEAVGDCANVYRLTKDAFEQAEHSDGDEQELVETLRNRAEHIPELSLVAVLDGEVVGHIMFSQISVGEHTALCLGPISVLPKLQRQGIGGALIERGHQVAHGLGFNLCLLVGHAEYYPCFGYERADLHGITFPYEAPAECKMVKFLTERGREVKGVAVFPVEFAPQC